MYIGLSQSNWIKNKKLSPPGWYKIHERLSVSLLADYTNTAVQIFI